MVEIADLLVQNREQLDARATHEACQEGEPATWPGGGVDQAESSQDQE